MCKKIFQALFLSLTLFTVLHAIEEEEFVVRLRTESPLLPVYIADISSEGSGMESSYLAQLEKVLEFDLNINGRTQVAASTPARKALAEKEKGKNSISAGSWKELNVAYVIKPSIVDKKLTAKVFSVNPSTVYECKSLTLTGNISTDRQVIHQLSDLIFKRLFNLEGIATTHILYTVKVNNPDTSSKTKTIAEVWECDYDGANARQVTHEGRLCVTPSYLPPKPGFAPGSFFYVCYRASQPKIYFASLKDGNGQPFCTLKGTQLMPMASPKRDNVAFICDVSGNPDLFIQPFNPNTLATDIPRQIFAAVNGVQGTPSFSPDGKRIAFVSNKDGTPRIYVMDIPPAGMPLKSIKTTMISKKNKESTSPCWSPDGSLLAYSSTTNGTRQIWIYDFETKQEKQITMGPSHKENPSWAPDSFHLVFNSDSPEMGFAELHLIHLNANESVKITHGSGEKRFPNWEPRLISNSP